jgi:tetratricopeptide (TPR) repeat protein
MASSHKKRSGKKPFRKTAKPAISRARQNKKDIKLDSHLASAILTEARQLYFQNKYKEVAEILEHAIPHQDLFSIDEKRVFYRLQALSLPHLDCYIEAESFSRKGLELDASDFDHYFVLSYVALFLTEYEDVLNHGNKFLELYDIAKRQGRLDDYLTSNNLHLVYNYMGVAYRQRNDRNRAEDYFKRAIVFAPRYSHPYVNLTNLYLRNREYAKAEDIIEKGLEYCSQVQELRILKKSAENRTTVSACMIVKNEEEHLQACLESIRDWVDEIIVVDTGSTDRTVEIAKSFGAKIFFQQWEGDFSKARNYSLAQADKDWIFIIDADEEFVREDIPLIKKMMGQDKFRLISINVYNMNKATGEYTSFLPSNRLFRRDAGFYYEGIVHNQLIFTPQEHILRAGIRLKHYGYSLSPEKMKKKLMRSRELLEKQLETRPNDSYAHFNYAQLLRGSGAELDEETAGLIIKHAQNVIELTNDSLSSNLHLHLMAHHQLITTYIYQKNYREAERLCLKALELKADYLDPILSLGHIYSHLKELDKAEEYFRRYLNKQALYDESQETTNIILLYIRAKHIAYYGLGLIAHYKGQLDKAEEYFRMVISEFDPYLDTHVRLARIHLDRSELDKAIEHIEKELQFHPHSDLGHLYKGEYYLLRNEPTSAEPFIARALELTKDNAEVFEKAGCIFANRGQYAQAIPLFERLILIKPEHAHGWKLLGRACFDSGNFEKAMDAYEEAVEFQPNDAEVLTNLASCHFKFGKYEKAEEFYQQSLSFNQNLAATYRNLGLTKLYLAKVDEALTLLEKYIEIAPDDYEIDMALGTIYLKLEQYANAILHFEKYLATNPRSVEALFKISECYFCLGYTDSAKIGYEHVLRVSPEHVPSKERLAEINSVIVST